MIRIGEHKDIYQGAQLLKEYVQEFEWGKDIKQDNTEYYKQLMNAIATDKTAVVSVNDGIIDGVLLGFRTPNILNPHNTQLQIIVTWVHPSKRGSSIFYRMNKFLEDNIVKAGEEIIYHEITETNVNYKKLGYKKLSTLHIKGTK